MAKSMRAQGRNVQTATVLGDIVQPVNKACFCLSPNFLPWKSHVFTAQVMFSQILFHWRWCVDLHLSLHRRSFLLNSSSEFWSCRGLLRSLLTAWVPLSLVQPCSIIRPYNTYPSRASNTSKWSFLAKLKLSLSQIDFLKIRKLVFSLCTN